MKKILLAQRLHSFTELSFRAVKFRIESQLYLEPKLLETKQNKETERAVLNKSVTSAVVGAL